MAWLTDTAVDGLTAFNDIIDALKDPGFMGSGDEWTELYRQDMLANTTLANLSDKRLVVVLSAPGEDGETLYFVLSYFKQAGVANTFFIQLHSFATIITAYPVASAAWQGVWSNASVGYVAGNIVHNSSFNNLYYVCIAPHTSGALNRPDLTGGSPYWLQINLYAGIVQYAMSSSTKFIKSWNGEGAGNSVKYWLRADKQGACVVFKSGTAGSGRYHMGIFAAAKRFGPIDFNPYPVVLATNGNATVFSDANDGNIPDRNQAEIRTYTPNLGVLTQSQLVFAGGGNTGPLNLMPNPVDGAISIHPLHILMAGGSSNGAESVSSGFVGVLDWLGVCAIPPGVQSEDTIDVPTSPCTSETWMLVENVYRNISGLYMALRLT